MHFHFLIEPHTELHHSSTKDNPILLNKITHSHSYKSTAVKEQKEPPKVEKKKKGSKGKGVCQVLKKYLTCANVSPCKLRSPLWSRSLTCKVCCINMLCKYYKIYHSMIFFSSITPWVWEDKWRIAVSRLMNCWCCTGSRKREKHHHKHLILNLP